MAPTSSPGKRPVSRRIHLHHAVSEALGAHQDRVEGRRLVTEACPLLHADRILLHLPDRSDEPVLLVTTDLDDPLPRWRQTRTGRRRADAVRWLSAAALADDHPPVLEALKRCRHPLDRRDVEHSPRLSPALPLLLEALGGGHARHRDWQFRHEGRLLASLGGVNTGTAEVFVIRVSEEGGRRWPALVHRSDFGGPRTGNSPYPHRWEVPPDRVPALVRALAAPA